MRRLHSSQQCHYRYDALDRLIGHTPSDEPQLQRFYCKNRMTTEIQDAMKYSIVQHGDLLLAQLSIQDNAVKASLLATDQQRTVTQSLNADHPPQPIAYSPYGHRAPENGELSLLGFNGERPDPVTGHYLLGCGYRAFNPALMRFNSPDRLSPFGEGGLNPYTYCLGDPTNNSDPDGHSTLGLGAVLRLRILAKRAAINVVKKNGTITMHRNSSIPLISKPRPGITAKNAVNQRSRIEKLYHLESNRYIENQKFNYDLAFEKNTATADPSMKKRFDLLSSIQTKSRTNSLWSDAFDYRKLAERTDETASASATRIYYLDELTKHTLSVNKQNRGYEIAKQIDEAYFIRIKK